MRNYYSLIARAVGRLGSGTADSRRALYERARAAQLKNIDPAFSPAAIECEREALEQAIRKVEVESATSDTAQAESDAKIVFDFADFCEKTTTRPDCFYDASILPYSKEMIISAIEREIVRSPLDAHVNWLRTGGILMWNFLAGVGPDPVPFTGADRSQLPRGRTQAPLDELRRLISSPDYKRAEERSASFMVIAERENKEIEERIANALRIRSARLSGQSQADKAVLDEHERRFGQFSKNRD